MQLLLTIDIERNSKNNKPINSKTIVNQGAIEKRRIKPEAASAAYTKMPRPWAIPNATPALRPSLITEFINKIKLGPGHAVPARQTIENKNQSNKDILKTNRI